MKMSVKKFAKENVKFFAGVGTAVLAFAIQSLGCGVLTLMTMMSLGLIYVMVRSPKYTKKFKAIVLVMAVLAMMTFGLWHWTTHQDTPVDDATTAQTETVPEETETEPEEEIAEETEVTVPTDDTCSGNGRLDAEGRKKCIDLTATNNNSKDVTGNNETQTKVEGNETTKFGEESQADKDTQKELAEAEKNPNKKVEDLNEGVKAVTDVTPVEDDKKVEEKDEDSKIEVPADAEEVKSEESKDANDVKEDKKEEAPKADDFKELDDKALEDLFDETEPETKEEAKLDDTLVVETEEASSNFVVEDLETEPEEEAVENVVVPSVEAQDDEVVVEDEVVEEVKEVAPVTVEALDGYEAIIGSTMQYRVTGDDLTIEGLDGLEYTFIDGVLSINVGEEATTITVVISNSVSSVTFDIVVNGIR